METTTSASPAVLWRRPREGRALGGVAAAVALRTGIGVIWVRLAFIVTTFFAGLGALAYVVGWLTIPDEGKDRSLAADLLAPLEAKGRGRLLGAILLTVAGLVLLATADIVSGRWVLIGSLAVLGILLYRGEILGGPRPEPPPPMLMPEPAEPLSLPADGGAEPTAPPLVVTEPAEPKPRSLLGRLTLAGVFVTIGLIGVLAAADVASPTLVDYFAAALGVTGVGLLIGTLYGRARWLIALGLVLTPIVLVLDVMPTTWSTEVGDRFYAPTLAGGEYRIGAGTLLLDLTDLEAGPEGADPIVAEVGAGELRILLPADRGAVIDAEVGIGELRIEGELDRGGLALDEQLTIAGPDPITVDAAGGFGLVDISWEDE